MNDNELRKEISYINILDTSYGILQSIRESKDVSIEMEKINKIFEDFETLQFKWEKEIDFILNWAYGCDDLNLIEYAISLTNPGMIRFRLREVLSKKSKGEQ